MLTASGFFREVWRRFVSLTSGNADMVVAGRLCIAMAILATSSVVFAQPKFAQPKKTVPSPKAGARRAAAAASQSAVDVVRLANGKSLRGAIAWQNGDGSLMMGVSRDWLRRANPEILENAEQDETATRRAALEQLRDRIRKELVSLPDESQLTYFLRTEQSRVDELLAKRDEVARPQFVWVDLPKKQVSKFARASADRQKIAAWAWYEQLADVETRNADELAEELKLKRIDPTQLPPDLSDRFSPRLQDDREWNARMALIAYGFDKPLNFQGTGETLIRTDAAANGPNMAALIPQLLGGQVDTLLKELLNEGGPGRASSAASDDWLKPAIKIAEKEKARGFRATRVDVNLAGRQATVVSAFAAQTGNGKWETVWSERVTEEGSKPRDSIEKTITDDPQVKSALELLKSIGAGGEDQVQQAIRVGAATMAAQQNIDGRFTVFQQSFGKRLDGPPLRWSN